MTSTYLFDPDMRAYNAQAIETCKVDDLPTAADNYCLEPKWDGFRLLSHIKDDDQVDTFTRSLKSQNGKIPYIDEQLAKLFPPMTVVDGEIIALEEHADAATGEIRVINNFEYVQSIMGCKPEKALARAMAGRQLHYVIFDIIYMSGFDMRQEPFSDRRKCLEQFIKHDELGSVQLTPQFEAKQEHHDRLVELGYEGTIAKHNDMPYKSGERGAKKKEAGVGMYKLKMNTEMDVVLIGIKPGTPGSEFDGLAGALIYGQPLTSMPDDEQLRTHMKFKMYKINGIDYIMRGQCSGIDMDERRRITDLWKNDPDKLFGTVFSVRHMGIYPDGLMQRHPQFSRWRDDKPIEDIVWDA